MNKDMMTAVLIDHSTLLTLQQLCQLLKTQEAVIIELVDQELIAPQGAASEEWRFDSICIKKAKTALSFQRDLAVNLSGIALAFELLDKIEQLEGQVKILQGFSKL